MPRKPRCFLPGAIYHVYSRVARGEFVFDDPADVETFIETVHHVMELDGWTVLAWCLMGNHYHLVVQTGPIPLWRSMARLQGTVSRQHNRRHRYLGRLWQSRYKARVIETDEYFRQVVAYVHLNPVTAGIVDDPASYPHSGHAAILGRRPARLVNVLTVLAGFTGGSLRDRRHSYAAAVRAVADARWLSRGIRELPWWVGAGDIDEVVPPDHHVLLAARTVVDDGRRPLPFPEFVRRYEEVSGVLARSLAGRDRRRSTIERRIEFTALAVGRYELKSSEVAQELDKHPSTVGRWLGLAIRQERTDPDFRRRLDLLDAAISSPHLDNATMRYVEVL